jgi:hypothetical protein
MITYTGPGGYVATLQNLSSRLRAEIGDTGRTFIDTFTGDGITTRYQLTQSPVQGDTLVVKVGSTDVSFTSTIEEGPGVLTLVTPPASGAVITVTGIAFRYFTDSEILYYINSAFAQHAKHNTNSDGSQYQLYNIPIVDEYPIIILASSLSLYTLATDAAFDINIFTPDGVTIPRSERYHQLMEIVEARRTQYKELCSMLNLGIYRMEVQTLRRISRLTNRYIPVYKPQEIDDGSIPQRVTLPLPSYGDTTPDSVPNYDLTMYAGDTFTKSIKFAFSILNFTPLAQIRLYPQVRGNRIGPILISTFTTVKSASTLGGVIDTITISLAAEATAALPRTSYWDLQLTDDGNSTVKTFLSGKIFTEAQVSSTTGGY